MVEIALCCAAAFTFTYALLPSIIRIAALYGLMDVPDERKSHTEITPSFGGVGIFSGLLISLLLFCPGTGLEQVRFILAALIIVFAVGALDDLNPISPFAKLAGQLAAVVILVFFADIRLSSFHGFLGLETMSYWLSTTLSCLVYIFLINSFNLIDGINGLSSSVAILTSAILGVWFLTNDQTVYSLIALSVAGSTLAFLKYNITPARIFMGDTGSLVLGTVCAVLVITFLEQNTLLAGGRYAFQAGPSVALGLLIIPVFDTARVFIYRIVKGRSPFAPDKGHIHHLLLDLGWTHMQATSTLLMVNIGFLVFAIEMQHLSSALFFTLSFAMAYLLTQAVQLSLYFKRRKVVSS